jgi:hypothetical protein
MQSSYAIHFVVVLFTYNLKSKRMKVIQTLKEATKLPKVVVALDKSEEGLRIFQSFTKRHPKYFVIQNKSVGVALINLQQFETEEEYIKAVNGKNSAAYFSRKATRSGYLFKEINPHKHYEEIAEINNSAKIRQGKEMDESYRKKIDFPINANNLYYGVFKGENLISYVWVVKTGELAILNRILGHSDYLDAGIMYLMVTSLMSLMIKEKQIKYAMYDTLLGASDGLKLFKTRSGFRAYNVNWIQS